MWERLRADSYTMQVIKAKLNVLSTICIIDSQNWFEPQRNEVHSPPILKILPHKQMRRMMLKHSPTRPTWTMTLEPTANSHNQTQFCFWKFTTTTTTIIITTNTWASTWPSTWNMKLKIQLLECNNENANLKIQCLRLYLCQYLKRKVQSNCHRFSQLPSTWLKTSSRHYSKFAIDIIQNVKLTLLKTSSRQYSKFIAFLHCRRHY